MAIDEARRRAYLEAMGIPIWEVRGRGPRGRGAPAPAQETVQAGDRAASSPEPRVDLEPGGEPAVPTDIAAMDAPALERTIRACTACGLCATRTQAVPGVGNVSADLLVIGEAPGQEEDRRGEPFVGRAGQLLDRMLAAIGLDRQTVYITNVLKCRPPNNRDPKAEEVQACAAYLRRQIELIQPKAILSVGRISAQSLLGTDESIGRLRECWHRYGPRDTPLRVTYHPAYLLRSPAQKRKSWSDLKAVRSLLLE